MSSTRRGEQTLAQLAGLDPVEEGTYAGWDLKHKKLGPFIPVPRVYRYIEKGMTELQRRVYVHLVDFMVYRTHVVQRSHGQVAKYLGASRRNVLEAVKTLHAAGLLRQFKAATRTSATTWEVMMPEVKEMVFAVAKAKHALRASRKPPAAKKAKETAA